MLFFNRQMPQATRAHLETQFNFATEMSKQFFNAAQRFNELNIQIAQSAMQDTLSSTREVFAAQDPYDALSAAASQVQPVTERLRSYQQNLSDIAARTQADLARTAESHVPEASRTAAAMADEVARNAAEQTQKATQRQRSAMERATAAQQKPDAGKSANVH